MTKKEKSNKSGHGVSFLLGSLLGFVAGALVGFFTSPDDEEEKK